MTAPTRPLRVLVVEDDDDHADLTVAALTAHDERHVAVRARTGEEALAALRGEGAHAGRLRPDIVLLDLDLPGCSGIDVLADLKSDRDLDEIPVVVLTTSDSERDRQAAYHNHANSYLVKPNGFPAFEAMVRAFGDYWGRWNRPSDGYSLSAGASADA